MQSSSRGRVGVLIQARMSSRRVPGKVLRKIAGKPMLAYVVERASAVVGADLVAVITSRDPSDDLIETFAAENHIALYRGPLEDVAGRFLSAAETFGLDAFARVNADSPLIDPRLIARGIALYRERGADLTTNVLRRTYPVGMSVEVLDGKRFCSAYREMNDIAQREHVTRFYYQHPERFRIVSFENNQELGNRTMAIDEEADIARIEKVIAALEGDHRDYDCAAICSIAERLGVLAEWRA